MPRFQNKSIMKKLSTEEAQHLVVFHKGRESAISRMVKSLQLGEAIEIPHQEVKYKTAMYRSVSHIAKSQNKKFEAGMNLTRTHYLIKRVA